MDYEPITQNKLKSYEELFRICFPKSNLNQKYLEWLYFQNPIGPVFGFDAIEEGSVVAHYACIPTRIDDSVGLLSLNTATHPEFKSRGLLQKLANMTYSAAKVDFDFVVGVANNNSAGILVERLGFKELGKLNLRWGRLNRTNEGVRRWTLDDLSWRKNSPKSKYRVRSMSSETAVFYCRPMSLPIRLKANVKLVSKVVTSKSKNDKFMFGLTLDWNRENKPFLYLPEALKPSPLILVFKLLKEKDIQLNSWSFPDFDAY